MRLSVIVPVFNKAPFIEECFASIFTQSYSDFEVIAVDDKSTDDSLSVLRQLKDDRLKVVALERNVGPGGAAQRAMDLAQGEYIIRVDADDLCMPERFARQVDFMDRNPGLIASGGALQLFGSEKDFWPMPVGEDACRAELLFGNPVSQGASIMRAAPLREHGLRYEDHWPRIGEDWFFWARIAPFGAFNNLPEPLIMYRRGAANSTFGQDAYTYREHIMKVMFAMLGIDATDDDIESHLLLLRTFKRAPDAQLLRAAWHWMARLKALNAQRGLFSAAAFDARLRQAWRKAFFAIADRERSVALQHWLLGPERPAAHLIYLATLAINSMLGRAPAR